MKKSIWMEQLNIPNYKDDNTNNSIYLYEKGSYSVFHNMYYYHDFKV